MQNPKYPSGHEIHITGHHFEPTDAIRNYIIEKIERVEPLTPDLINVHVTFSQEKKVYQKVTIHYLFSHFEIFVQAETDDMYKSIDLAIDRLWRKISKWKEHIQNHHHKSLSEVEATIHLLDQVYNAEKEEIEQFNDEIVESSTEELSRTYPAPKVVSRQKKKVKTLNLQEALMKFDCMITPFLLFRSEEDRKMKILYRREDDTIALIEFE